MSTLELKILRKYDLAPPSTVKRMNIQFPLQPAEKHDINRSEEGSDTGSGTSFGNARRTSSLFNFFAANTLPWHWRSVVQRKSRRKASALASRVGFAEKKTGANSFA